MEKEIDSKSINSVFKKDCLAIAVFAVGLWAVLIPVLITVLPLAPSAGVRTLMIAMAVITGLALTWALLATYLHIKRYKDQIYKLDLERAAQMKAQK